MQNNRPERDSDKTARRSHLSDYTHKKVFMREFEVLGNISSIISSIGEYFDRSTDVWFRGQPTYDYELTPSIFRQGKAYVCQFDESKMYKEFVMRNPEQSGSHKNVYEWLTLMQHYGIPTRLLDWTTNLLVALYFSCSQDVEADGALFVFDPAILLNEFLFNPLIEMQVESSCISDFYRKLIFEMGDILDDEAMINDFRIADIKRDPLIQVKFIHIIRAKKNQFQSVKTKIEFPMVDIDGNKSLFTHQDITRIFSNIIPCTSPYLNQRIKQQHGCFTCHGGKYFEGEEFIKFEKMEEHPYLQCNLVKVRVKASDKEKIVHELKLSGIRESILFPEMEKQAKEIKMKYKKPLDIQGC